MIFSLAIYHSDASGSASNAYRFAKAAIESGHSLYRVFFYHDGAYTGSFLNTPPQDEKNLTTLWQNLAKENNIDLVVCIAAGLRRGIVNQEEADRYDLTAFNLANNYELSGLGQLLDATVSSDRLLTFGG